MRIAPDINNPFPGWHGGGNNAGGGQGGGGGGAPKKTGAFMPSELGGLANDLQMGYGGTDAKWKSYLRGTYDPVKSMQFNFGGGGGGGNGGGNNPGSSPNGSGQDNNNGGFNPTSPRNQMAMPMGSGLLNAQMQQPQQQGLLGDIDPAVLAFLSGNMRR